MKVGISKSSAELCVLRPVYLSGFEVEATAGVTIAYTSHADHVGYLVECCEGSFLLTKELVHKKIEILGEL